jgi:small subunit ribosomal protein S21
MIIIKVGKNENIDRALKRYKYKVIKTKQNEQVRNRQEFKKKCVKKREKIQKAKYVQKLKDNYNDY